MPDPAPNRKNTKAIKVVVSIAIAVAFIVIMFAPIVPIQYEEIVGELGDPNGGPVGRMVTKNVSPFQIMTGAD
jgi:ACR3 family arsenite efflux pump ArsB